MIRNSKKFKYERQKEQEDLKEEIERNEEEFSKFMSKLEKTEK